jgi:tetratricopeptide (TPR) repeat protein
MEKATLFVSYKFNDPMAEQLRELVADVAPRLRRLIVIDGKSVNSIDGFSTHISSVIKEKCSGLLAIFVGGDHGNRNVLYEVGVAVGAGKLVILAADHIDTVPSMLRFHEIIVPQTRSGAWYKEFQDSLEKKLRTAFQLPEDHLIEDKLQRRYSSEEKRYLKDSGAAEPAMQSIRLGDFAKAEAILKNRLDRDESDIDAMFLLSETYYLEGCASESPSKRANCFRRQLDLAEQGLKTDAKNILCLSAKAIGHMRLGQFSEVREALQILLSLDPRFSVGLYSAACLEALMFNKNEMLDYLKRALSINSDWKDFAKGDPDFSGYYQDREWQKLVYS